VVIAPLVLGAGVAAARPHNIKLVTMPRTPGHDFVLDGQQSLFINRCVNGCTVRSGGDSATDNMSSIAQDGSYTFTESPKMTDAQWGSFLQCMKEVYSPYNVTVTDQQPTSGQYNEEIVAGTPATVGLDMPGVEGLAIVSPDCTPYTNYITYAFLDAQVNDDEDDVVLSTCWTAAQEAAHLYGLDHEYEFTDGTSACNDPMTYRDDCGGEKFFRNKFAKCGEFGPPTDDSPRPGCGPNNACATTQNSHAKLLDALGPGTPITTPPTSSIINPTAGGTIQKAAAVFVTAGAQRGVDHVDLYLNGYKWLTDKGTGFGNNGQKTPDEYEFTLPASVPNGVIDIVAKAYDDLQIETDSATVTVTLGSPCTDASSCAKGQSCDAGKCEWPAATGMLGDTCTYPQFCTSGECEGDSTQYCTIDCEPGVDNQCDMGYDCVEASATAGFCLPKSSGGCCSVGGGDSDLGMLAGYAGTSLLVLSILLRRRARA
jgi:hypothetical protein